MNKVCDYRDPRCKTSIILFNLNCLCIEINKLQGPWDDDDLFLMFFEGAKLMVPLRQYKDMQNDFSTRAPFSFLEYGPRSYHQIVYTDGRLSA